jgi:hypothetical protein
MDSAQLQSWLKNGPAAGDVEVLREFVKRYPYAGPLRMMLAKASEGAQNLERRDHLLQAGAHVPSRRALFAYLTGPALVEAARAVHVEIESAPEVSEEELVGLVWHGQDDPAPQPMPETEATDLDAPSPEADSRESMVAAIASVIEKDVQAWASEAEAAASPDAGPSVDEPSQRAGVAVPVVGTTPRPSSLFGQWLAQRARETGFGSPQLAEKGAAALIDAFLAKGDVKIGPVRDSLETTEEWAKQGLVEDPSLVTETMAKLYAQQGQIGRARKAYKLLALKYPEKSVYFAAQLKMLRNS